jgi:hypothetical protein
MTNSVIISVIYAERRVLNNVMLSAVPLIVIKLIVVAPIQTL